MAAGTLYLIPVGLGPAAWQRYLPQHVREIACALDYFIVESAKSARAELKRVGMPRSLRELRIVEMPERASWQDWDALLQPVLAGSSAGLMSEAGCPGVADPGANLVRRAHEAGIRVVPLVGPSSILLALMASGLNGQSFAFHGYLPIPQPRRRDKIVELEGESIRHGRTQIFIETPYRNLALFRTLIEACAPATLLCAAAHLTLDDETVATRSIAEWRRAGAPAIERKPTVFLLLGQDRSKQPK